MVLRLRTGTYGPAFKALSEYRDSFCEWSFVVAPRDRRRRLDAWCVWILHHLFSDGWRNGWHRWRRSRDWTLLVRVCFVLLGARSRSRWGRLRLLTVRRGRSRERGKCEKYTQSELRSAQTELPYAGLGQSVHGRFRSEHTPPGLYAQRSLGNLATKQRPACDIQANLRGESGVNQRQINGVRTDG